MLFLLAVLIGVLYGSAVYLLLRRNIFKLILGLIFLGHATNLLLFVAGGLTGGFPAFIRGLAGETERMADPLPQALILTAIVIGLGVTAFIYLKCSFSCCAVGLYGDRYSGPYIVLVRAV